MSESTRPEEIVARVLTSFLRDADEFVGDGLASREAVDTSMRLGAGHRAGPFESRGIASGTSEETVDTTPFPGTTVVVGTGRMASGIVESVARAGLAVVALGRTREAASRLIENVEGSLGRAVAKGKLDAASARRARASFSATTSPDAVQGAALVLEAVVEDLTVKRRLIADLDNRWPVNVPFATNTSSFTVAEIMAPAATARPTLALHFFNPASVMRLVEVVAGPGSDAATVGRGLSWVQAIGKTPVIAPDRRGFLVNRLLIPMLNDAVRVHEDGVPIADIENAMTGLAGHPMGPFALMDMIGLDVMVAALDALAESSGASEDRIRPAHTLREMVSAGRLGRKSDDGFTVKGKS